MCKEADLTGEGLKAAGSGENIKYFDITAD